VTWHAAFEAWVGTRRQCVQIVQQKNIVQKMAVLQRFSDLCAYPW